MEIKQIVNQGKGTQPKVDRNKELAIDYNDGMEIRDIGNKYNISHTRVHQLVTKMGLKRRKVVTKKKSEK